MRLATVVHYVTHREAANEKSIGKELAMATPRDRLGTHDSDPFAGSQLFHLAHDPFESGSEHEIGVGAKRPYFPGGVLRIGGWFAKPTQVATPDILDLLAA